MTSILSQPKCVKVGLSQELNMIIEELSLT